MQKCVGVAGGTGQAIQNSDTERYAARAADKFTFLRPDRIMDSKKHRPDHPDYDPGTLHVPDNWFKANKISEGQQQWYALHICNPNTALNWHLCATVHGLQRRR